MEDDGIIFAISSGVTLGINSIVGSYSAQFDGNSFVQITHQSVINIGGEFTIEFWLYSNIYNYTYIFIVNIFLY